MKGAVLDASVLVAVLSPDEIHHAGAKRLYATLPSGVAYWVPAVFRLEVVAALSRRERPAATMEKARTLVGSARFDPVAIDAVLIDRASEIASTAGLRAYDALYAAVASMRSVPLVTLDRDVARRLREARSAVVVISLDPDAVGRPRA